MEPDRVGSTATEWKRRELLECARDRVAQRSQTPACQRARRLARRRRRFIIAEVFLVGAVLACGPVPSYASPAAGSDTPPVPSGILSRVVVAAPESGERGGRSSWSIRPDEPPGLDVDFSSFFSTLGWNFTRGLVSTRNLLPLALGGGAALAVHPIDDHVTERFRGDSTTFGDAGNLVGHPVTMIVSVAGALAVVPFTENRRFRTFAFTLAQAQLLDSTLKYTLKATVSRTRPNGENDNAFPSGHTSTTFAAATVATHYYGWKVGVPAYAIAALVGASRVEQGKHYLSDVVFGATLGYLAGRTAVRGTQRSLEPRRMTLLPVVGWDRAGLVVQWRW